jgi:carboxypeptidase C (cathepsin A)
VRRQLQSCLFLAVAAALFAVTSTSAEPETRPAKADERRSERRPETRPDAKPDGAPGSKGDKVSVTDHETTIAGKSIKYRATAGTYQLKDEAGKAKADLFFVAYEQTPAGESADAVAKRPITFVFNGGPGAASVWLHLGTAGPKRVKLTENGAAPPPPYAVVDNEFSWLDATDLVFIDPVGTGYSRAAQGEDAKQFYGVENDLRWVAEFIRLYATRNGRWPSPKFLAGESYGTTRAAGLSQHLLERQGIALNGVILISTVLNFQTIYFSEGNDLPYVLFLPAYTAIAHYHKKLAPELQDDLPKALKESEAFALNEYTPALAKGAALSADEKTDVAKKLARLTGLPTDVARKANLRIDSDLFRKTLLVDQEKVVGRFDARLAGFDPNPLGDQPDHDPSFNQFFAAYAGAFNDYVRRTLKYETDVQYDVLSGRVQPWDYGRGGQGYLNTADDLERAMRLSPHTKLLVCSGLYDLATPYFGAGWTVRHMKLSPELRKNVTETFYPGGHMMYHEAGALKQLREDVGRFIAGATR